MGYVNTWMGDCLSSRLTVGYILTERFQKTTELLPFVRDIKSSKVHESNYLHKSARLFQQHRGGTKIIGCELLPKFRFLEDNIQTCPTAYHGNSFLYLYTVKYALISTDWNLSEDPQCGQNKLHFYQLQLTCEIFLQIYID